MRFALAGTLSDDPARRMRVLENLLAGGEIDVERERLWRGALEMGPLDDELLAALEEISLQSPEASYRGFSNEVAQGLTYDALVPDNADLFTELLSAPASPQTLAEYRDQWVEAAAGLDPRRLSRAIALAAPLSILRGELLAPAAQALCPNDRLALAQLLARHPDPFSMLAAFQIAISDAEDPDFKAVIDQVLPRLIDGSDARREAGTNLLCAFLVLTKSLVSRRRTLVDWPIYARRLVCFLHASHLARTFGNGQVDPDEVSKVASRPMVNGARLVELCDAGKVPFDLAIGLTPARVRAILLARVKEALEVLSGDQFEGWKKAVDEAIATAVAKPEAIMLLMPAPFDPFERDWHGLIPLPSESVDDTLSRIETGRDKETSLSDLFHLAMAFDIEGEARTTLAAHIPAFVKSLSEPSFAPALEAALQLAARWRLPELAETLVNLSIGRTAEQGNAATTAPPIVALLAAASNADPADWGKRAGEYLAGFAFVTKPGRAIDNLLAAIEILRDASPALEADLTAARSFTLLARDRLPSENENSAVERTE